VAELFDGLKPAVEAIQRSLGPDLTVWGIKWNGSTLHSELYFYDPKKEAPEASVAEIKKTLAPFFAFEPSVADDVPYMMASFDLTRETVEKRAISELNLYLTGEPGHAGRSYKLRAGSMELENVYRFIEPKRDIDQLLSLVKSSSFVDFGDPRMLAKVVIPELFACKKVCVSKKRTADAIYYSGITIDQLRWFLERFEYPEPVVRFVRNNSARFEHLYFDVGLDYRTDPQTGRLVYPKTSYYGTL